MEGSRQVFIWDKEKKSLFLKVNFIGDLLILYFVAPASTLLENDEAHL